jgi:hypothetical protein
MNILKYILSTQIFRDFINGIKEKSPKRYVALRYIAGLLIALAGAAYSLDANGILDVPDAVIKWMDVIFAALATTFGLSFTAKQDKTENT